MKKVLFSIQINRFLQAAVLLAVWKISDLFVSFTHLPVPGSIIGMGLVLLFLVCRVFRISAVQKGADMLLRDMLLFFVPAVLALLNHHEFLGWVGLKIMAVILLGTVIVMISTALTVELCFKVKNRLQGAAHVLE